MTQPFELISQYNQQYVVIQMDSFSSVLLNLVHHARPCMGKLLLPFLLLNSALQCNCLMLFFKVIISQSTLPSTIRQSLKIGVSRLFFRISFPPSHLQLAG
jgi:hypothetical protein